MFAELCFFRPWGKRLFCCRVLLLVLLLSAAVPNWGQTPPRSAPSLAPAQTAALSAQITTLNRQIAALTPTTFGQPWANPRTDGSGLVFAHSVLAPFNGATNGPNGAYGAASGWRQTIQELKLYSVDGIAADMFTATAIEKDNLTTLFQAADQENAACTVSGTIPNNGHGVSKFYILPTPDFSTIPESTASMTALAQLLVPFLADPACATYEGHPVLSCYEGDGGGAAICAQVYLPFLAQINVGLKALGKPSVQFLPGWGGASGSTAAQEITAAGAIGAWKFADPTTPLGLSSPLPAQESLAASVQASFSASGKPGLWMQSFYPLGYWKALGTTAASGKSYNEYRGMQALAVNMASAIFAQHPYWMELLTLDDAGEGTAFGSDAASEYLPGHWDEIPPTNTPDFYQSNAGLHVAMEYYIQWYKTGVQPRIGGDTLIVSNLTQLAVAASAPSSDPTGPLTQVSGAAGDSPGLQNHVDVMALLTSSGQVQVSGVTPVPTVLPVSAGVSQLVFPVTQAGTPLVELLKNGQVRRQVTGHAIAASTTLVNLNPASYASVAGTSFTLKSTTTLPVDSPGILVRGTAGSSPLAVSNLVCTNLSGKSSVVIAQNDLHGIAGQSLSAYTPARGSALSIGKNNASSYAVFAKDATGTGLPTVAVPGYANTDNPYYTAAKQTSSTHWKVTCRVKRISPDPDGEAGAAMVCSTGGPAGNDYFGAEAVATIAVNGSITTFNVANITPISSDRRISQVSVPVNSLTPGKWYTVTLEYNKGALTATAVPSNQQL